MGAHGGAGRQQALDDGNGGRLPHVVGARLEGKPPAGHDAPGERLLLVRGAQNPDELMGQNLLLALVDILHGLEQQKIVAALLGGPDQGLHILGKAGAAVAGTREEEIVADA